MAFILDRLPENDDELWWTVKAMWNVVIPRHTCGNPEHTPPFEAFADAYFNRGGSITLWHGSRGLSGKSFMLSILGITKAFLLGADVNMLGGSLAQSTNLHEHMRNALNSENSPRYMIESEGQYLIKLSNKARIRPLTASQKTVRGPHPPFLILDEIDEMDIDILDAALGQPMPQKNYMGVILKPYTVMCSTWQNPEGTFTEVRRRFEERGLPVVQWCVAQDSLVTTDRGEVPVQSVRTSDHVMTREGWKPVQHVTFMGYKPTVTILTDDGLTLTLTYDHKVATAEGFIEAALLTSGSVLYTDARNAHAVPSISTNADSAGIGHIVASATSIGTLLMKPRSPLVLGEGNDLHMAGVDAKRSSAQVIEGHPLRNGTDDLLVDPAMSESGSSPAVLGIDLVPVTVDGGPPPQDALVSVVDDFAGDDGLPLADGLALHSAGAAPFPVPPRSGSTVSAVISHGLVLPVWDIGVHDVHEFAANHIVVSNCYQCSANPIDGWLTQETIEQKKLEIPAEMWRTEYELGEPAIGNRAFDPDAVDRMFSMQMEPVEEKISKDFEEYTFAKYERDGDYVAAADWGKEQDYTVISVWRYDRPQYELVYYMRVNRRPYPQMIGWFNDVIRRYNASAIHDGTGLGNVVNDYVDVRARSFIMTGEKRANMLSEYVNAVEKGAMIAPRIKTAHLAHKYCLLSGSLVWTIRGNVPIEQVKVGDLALTRRGYRRVTAVMDNGTRLVHRLRTSDGKELFLTGDHAVATPNGWVEAKDLQLGDVCFVTETDLAPPAANGSDVEVLPRVLVPVGAMSGSGASSSHPVSTQDVIPLGDGFQMGDLDAASISAQVVDGLQHLQGSDQRPIGSAVSLSRIARVRGWAAYAVSKFGNLKTPFSASIRKQGASAVEVGAVSGFSLAHVIECINTNEQGHVYDIEVEGEHEFFANGVLVHNCQVGDLYKAGKEYHLPDEVCSFALAFKIMGWSGKPVGPIAVVRDKTPTKLEEMFSPRQGEVYRASPDPESISLMV